MSEFARAKSESKGKAALWLPGYSILFISRFAKVTADNFASTAMVWLLIENGGNTVNASLLFVCSLTPQILLGALIGPLLGRGKLQVWMFCSDAVRSIVVFTVTVCAWGGFLPNWLFFVLATLQSAAGAVYNPASVALLPRIVNAELLQKANAVLQSSTPWLAVMAGCSFLLGITITAINVPETMLIQTTIPPDQQAHVYALVTSISAAFMPPAYLLAGWAAAFYGTGPVITSGGILILLAGALMLIGSPLVSASNRQHF